MGALAVVWFGLGQGRTLSLADVAVQHAVVGDVEGEQGASGVLQELPLIDQLDLALAPGEVLTEDRDAYGSGNLIPGRLNPYRVLAIGITAHLN